MRFAIALFATLMAVVTAQNNAREQFKEQNCASQACIDAVDDGCPLQNINFDLGCDENGAGQ